MSPIVVYSTLLRPDGRPYTVYYQPGDPDWTPLVDGNLRKKYQALYGQSEQPVAVDQLPPITVQVFGQPRLSVMRYKSTVIKGYTARLRLTGPLALIRLALDAGLGSKNSQGFGCLQLLGPVEPVVNRRPTADAHRQLLAGSTVQQTRVSGQSPDVGSNDSAPGGKPQAADS
ncbi:MAG: CRISPR-associated endoribonuclease Cas6 [Limnochordaceae bacterium]|nr:CRISPR-associated endoribonuclease Cas6 [Limnochordaceae bacterium]